MRVPRSLSLGRGFAAVLAIGFAIRALPSCVDAEGCYPGRYQGCACEDGWGYELCQPDHTYGACDCSGKVPGLEATSASGSGGAGGVGGGGGAGGSAGAGGALLPFMAPCTDDSQCESMLCFHFNAKGSHCTKPCTDPTECPPPSTGCSNMGVCKAP